MVVFLLSCAGFRGRDLLQGFWFMHQKWLGWTIRWAQKPVISRVTTPLIAIITPVKPIYFHPFIRTTHVTHSMYNDRLGGPPCTVLCFHFFNFHAWRFNNFSRSPREEKRDDWKTIGSYSFGVSPSLNIDVSLEHFRWIPLFEQILCSFISRGLALDPWFFGGFRVGRSNRIKDIFMISEAVNYIAVTESIVKQCSKGIWKNLVLTIFCGLFGMIRWPLERISDLQLGNKEGGLFSTWKRRRFRNFRKQKLTEPSERGLWQWSVPNKLKKVGGGEGMRMVGRVHTS